MKNKFGPILQLIFGIFLVFDGIFFAMYLCYLPFRLSLGESFTLTEMYFPDTPPETVSARTVLETQNLELLWTKEVDIDNPHKAGVGMFIPNEESFVFLSPQSELLVALAFATGDVLWETAVPQVSDIGLYNNHFYISSSWIYQVKSAPIDSNDSYDKCSFAGQATLVAINATTGEQVWKYSYWGSSGGDFRISQNNIYLLGSNDHGASQSRVRIDATDGTILERDCYQWPDEERELMGGPSLTYEREHSSPYTIIIEDGKERQLRWREIALWGLHEDNRLEILKGQTNETMGSVIFDGAALDYWDIDVAVQDNIVVIYLGDSHQFFAFRQSQN